MRRKASRPAHGLPRRRPKLGPGAGIRLTARQKASLASQRVFQSLLGLLLLLPLATVETSRRGLPQIGGGDEPHYLIIINSLLNDGDLDLRNNYLSVHQGSNQAGERLRQIGLDHHTLFHVDGRRYGWGDIYETQRWLRKEGGELVPLKRQGVSTNVESIPEYSIHPPGMAFILYPFLFPFRGTSLVEPIALLYSGIATILAMIFFRQLILGYAQSGWIANLVTAVTFLGTPAWHYGRSLFTEPYLLLFGVAAYALALRRRSGFWAGCSIALGMLMKPPFLLLAVPLSFFFLLQKEIKRLLLLSLPLALSAIFILWLNSHMFGSPWRTSIPFAMGSMKGGAVGLLLSTRHGLIPFAPAVVIALLCWPKFIRQIPGESLVIAGGFVLYFFLMALWAGWDGGWSYGPRLIVPVIPFLFVGLTVLPRTRFYKTIAGKVLTYGVFVTSVLFNLVATYQYWEAWNTHPLLALF